MGDWGMKYVYAAIMSLTATSAFAGVPAVVPEMSAGAGAAAVALLIGVAAIIRERSKRK